MIQETDITTFEFLESIQEAFLKESNNASSTGYDTRRVVNFFENTALLQVLKTQEGLSLNGSAKPVATLSLQNVAQKEEVPTFAIQIGFRPYEQFTKELVLVANKEALRKESERLVKRLQESLAKAESNASTQQAESREDAPSGTVSPSRAPFAEGDDEARSERRERRSTRSGLLRERRERSGESDATEDSEPAEGGTRSGLRRSRLRRREGGEDA